VKLVAKLQKNPFVETSFLPDRERARHEEDVRKQIELEYELRDKVGVPGIIVNRGERMESGSQC
jgi:hypothetical protein